jgi:multiple sugar transport system permease protein
MQQNLSRHPVGEDHSSIDKFQTMPSNSNRQNRNATGWLMAFPATTIICLFIIVPFLLGIYFSFTNQRFISPNPAEYVGTANFHQLLDVGMVTLEPERDTATQELKKDETGQLIYPTVRSLTRNNPAMPYYNGMREWFSWHSGDSIKVVVARDVVFMKALVNTFEFVLIVAPLQSALALLLALMINQKLRGINFFRTIFFMPVVVSIVVVSLLWRFIYSGDNGLLNGLLSFFTFGSFKPIDWLGTQSTALPAIMAMSIWQAVGFFMVIWLSGLQTIPASLYEAADIEGASNLQKFRFVTWPGLRNTAILVMVVITMQAFTLYPQIAVMTQGGPVDSTQSIMFQALEHGYAKQDIATGSAISVILFIIVISISMLQRYLTREKLT